MISLIAHEGAISRQIDSAERRAEMRCKKYNATNVHWKTVDDLLKKQASIMMKIETSIALLENTDGMSGVSVVSEFIKQKIPSKRSKNVANSNNQSVSNVDGETVVNLESDDKDDSFDASIPKATDVEIEEVIEKDVSECQ